jgi:hypothetical protein
MGFEMQAANVAASEQEAAAQSQDTSQVASQPTAATRCCVREIHARREHVAARYRGNLRRIISLFFPRGDAGSTR